MSSIDAPSQQVDYLPNLQDLIMTVWRHRITMVITILCISILGICGVLLKPNTYDASTTIMIKDNSVNLEDFKEFTDTPKFDAMTVLTEAKILMSPTLALKTIETTELYKTDEFKSSTGDPKGSLPQFVQNLKVSQQGISRIISVSFQSKDPELAAKVANAHVENYFASQIDHKTKRLSDLSAWFESRVKILKEDVIQKSRAASEYRATQKLVVGQDGQELIYRQINEVSAKIGAAETSKLDIDSQLASIESLKDSSDPDAIATIVNSALIQNFKSAVNQSAQETALLRGKYGDRHPAVLAATGKLMQARAALRDETRKIKETLKSDSLSAQAEIDMLKSHLAQLEKDASDMRGKAIIYEGLRLEEKTSQKLLDSFLASYEGLQSQNSIARSDAVVVSPAVAPALPVGPSQKTLILAVIILSVVGALGIVFVLEVMRAGIRNFEDVRKLGYKPLGILPDVPSPILVAQNPHNSGLKEALKRIYMTGLLPSDARAIMVTSALPGEGRTTFALTMAHYIGSLGHKVIVVDTDFMSRSNQIRANKNNSMGLNDYLTSQVDLGMIISTGEAGVSFITAGSQNAPSPDILTSERFTDLLKTLKQRYHYVLIDTSPLLAHAEAEAIARHVDGTIIVAEWMKTSQTNILNMSATLKQIKAPVLGVVMNKVDIQKYKTFTPGSDFLLPNISQANSGQRISG
ncbi:MAG: polysaccharide biosynthesis tyrosine autokinase [Alphaproteobacteria bacterium]|nr:polysaccharide biosynthesis tyrosine autokinase [Alphaproteobacteria bacterium]